MIFGMELVTPRMVQRARNTRRWHTEFSHRDQTLLDHGAGVALLALWLADGSLDFVEQRHLILFSLTHDLHETRFGDVPYPAKRLLKEQGIDIDQHCLEAFWAGDPSRFLPEAVRNLVAVADLLDAALFAQVHVPELADTTADQAASAARELLGSDRKVMEALGVIG